MKKKIICLLTELKEGYTHIHIHKVYTKYTHALMYIHTHIQARELPQRFCWKLSRQEVWKELEIGSWLNCSPNLEFSKWTGLFSGLSVFFFSCSLKVILSRETLLDLGFSFIGFPLWQTRCRWCLELVFTQGYFFLYLSVQYLTHKGNMYVK